MDREFWLGKWERGELGFHQVQGNPLLKAHIGRLGLNLGDRVFLPLCGKTGDIPWLLSRGYSVVGCELSERAVRDLFQELDTEFTCTQEGALIRYSAPKLDILVGDFFELTQATLGRVNAVYDRAALVALAEHQRSEYAKQLAGITNKAPVLLICFEYDPSRMDGPPFAIYEDEIDSLYGSMYRRNLIEKSPMEGGLKGRVDADETVWLLQDYKSNG